MERDRVISITLSEAEWQALVARHPQPVNWLREQIRSDLQDPRASDTAKSSFSREFPASPPSAQRS